MRSTTSPRSIVAFVMVTALAACSEMPAEPQPLFAHTNGAAVVNGGGTATVTDPSGASFDARVSIAASVNANGVANGIVNIIFGQSFSAAWGAIPGVHAIHLTAQIETITGGSGDAITLAGTALEVDVVPGADRLVFPNEPFQLVVTGPNTFTVTWCLLPTFNFQLNSGALSFGRRVPATVVAPRSTADQNSAGCPRG